MSSDKTRKALVLNKHYFPVNTVDWRKALEKIFAGRMFPLDITYAPDQDGDSLEAYEWLQPVTWDQWVKLPVRPYDQSIRTACGYVRAPSMVICAAYDKIKWHRVPAPTKQNIWARDNNTCCYTGVWLPVERRTVDHIIPKSKGGQDSWMNLVTCDVKINNEKADMDPEKFRLKLKKKPFIPKGAINFPILRPEWRKIIVEYVG